MLFKKTDQNGLIKLSNELNMPQDVICGTTIITLQGNNDLVIENYKGLICYSEQEIQIQGKKEVVKVTGKNLFIHYFSNSDMKITGNISCISFC